MTLRDVRKICDANAVFALQVLGVDQELTVTLYAVLHLSAGRDRDAKEWFIG